jgi:hypothetical protein
MKVVVNGAEFATKKALGAAVSAVLAALRVVSDYANTVLLRRAPHPPLG